MLYTTRWSAHGLQFVDKSMPKDLPGRQARCIQWIGRTSPSPSVDEVDAVAIKQGGKDPSDFF